MTTTSPPALLTIDVRSFYERFVTIAGKPTRHNREGLEWACSCIKCGGTDRASFWESGRYCCVRGCHFAVSSPYWFLREMPNAMDHFQACEALGIDPTEMFEGSQKSNLLPLWMVKDEPPNKKWQDAAEFFCHIHEKCLWMPVGKTALDYLHSRGLSDNTIKKAHLGLCPSWFSEPLELWGLDASQLNKEQDPQIKIPRGIVIPWRVNNSIWKIQLRRPVPGPTGTHYFEVIGSSECLYNSNSLRPAEPVLLVESELDALSAEQEASDLAACIATGSTSKAFSGHSASILLRASTVLQAFDTDPAGEAGAVEWIRALGEKSFRWPPLAHDVNDMLTSGLFIRNWIQSGLQLVSLELPEFIEQAMLPELAIPPALDTSLPPKLAERVKEFQSRPCASCGGFDWFIDYDGRLTCPCIIPKRARNPQFFRQLRG